MSQYYDGGRRTFMQDAYYPRGTRVILNPSVANGVTVAGATDIKAGTIFESAPGPLPEWYGGQGGTPVAVHLRTAQGTQQMIAAGAIAYGALVYPAASGQVSATSSGLPIGYCLSAATAQGDLIEILRLNH